MSRVVGLGIQLTRLSSAAYHCVLGIIRDCVFIVACCGSEDSNKKLKTKALRT